MVGCASVMAAATEFFSVLARGGWSEKEIMEFFLTTLALMVGVDAARGSSWSSSVTLARW